MILSFVGVSALLMVFVLINHLRTAYRDYQVQKLNDPSLVNKKTTYVLKTEQLVTDQVTPNKISIESVMMAEVSSAMML